MRAKPHGQETCPSYRPRIRNEKMKVTNIEDPDPSGVNYSGHKGTKARSYTSTLDVPCSIFNIPTLVASLLSFPIRYTLHAKR
jgi:hypothetical protein